MIKISKHEHRKENTVELKIEGKICGEWAQELKRMCQQILSGETKKLILDFTSVTSIDREGLQLLKKVSCSRIQIVGCNMFLKDLLTSMKMKEIIY